MDAGAGLRGEGPPGKGPRGHQMLCTGEQRYRHAETADGHTPDLHAHRKLKQVSAHTDRQTDTTEGAPRHRRARLDKQAAASTPGSGPPAPPCPCGRGRERVAQRCTPSSLEPPWGTPALAASCSCGPSWPRARGTRAGGTAHYKQRMIRSESPRHPEVNRKGVCVSNPSWEWASLPGSVPRVGQASWPRRAGQKREVGLHRALTTGLRGAGAG